MHRVSGPDPVRKIKLDEISVQAVNLAGTIKTAADIKSLSRS